MVGIVTILTALCGIALSINARKRGLHPQWSFYILPLALALNDREVLIDSELVYIDWHIPFWIFSLPFFLINLKKLSTFFISRKNIGKAVTSGLFAGIVLVLVFQISKYQSLNFKLSLNTYSIIYAISTAIGEELFFRGALLGSLKNNGVSSFWSLIVTVTLFALGHRHHVFAGNNLEFLAVSLLGVVGGIITLRYKNLTGSVVMHVLLNLSPYFLLT